MAEERSWVLTDVGANVWKESLFLGHEDLGVPDCTVSKTCLQGGLRSGVDLVEVTKFRTLLLDPAHPWNGAVESLLPRDSGGLGVSGQGSGASQVGGRRGTGAGLGWLKGFDECMVRCGLDSNGSPGEDVIVDNNGNRVSVDLTLHGKIANLPAHYLQVRSDPESGRVSVVGEVDESSLFLPGLRLRSTVSTTPRSNRLTIQDTITNLKTTPSELELVYHCNFGRPFLGAGSKMLAAVREVAPRDARAVEGIGEIDTYLPPTPGYVEQVYFHDLAEGASGRTLVALRNAPGDRAVVLRFNKKELPYFTQWKNTVGLSEGYVTGLEPGTNYPQSEGIRAGKGPRRRPAAGWELPVRAGAGSLHQPGPGGGR